MSTANSQREYTVRSPERAPNSSGGLASVTEGAGELKRLQKNIVINLVKGVVAMLMAAKGLARAHELLRPYGGDAWSSFLDSVGISKSHGYQLIRVARRFGDYPQEISERFTITSLIQLANSNSEEAITECTRLAEKGHRVSVSLAKQIVAKHRGSVQPTQATAVKVDSPIGSIVIHPRKDAIGVSELQRAIENLIAQHFAGGDK